MEKLTEDQLVEQIKNMTVLDLSKLVKRLEEEFGVTAAAPMAAMAMMPAGGGAPAVEEKTEFNVVLKASGPERIKVIKVVREITGLGIKEAKDLVDALPKAIKEGVSKDEAASVKAKFDGTGAEVEIN